MNNKLIILISIILGSIMVNISYAGVVIDPNKLYEKGVKEFHNKNYDNSKRVLLKSISSGLKSYNQNAAYYYLYEINKISINPKIQKAEILNAGENKYGISLNLKERINTHFCPFYYNDIKYNKRPFSCSDTKIHLRFSSSKKYLYVVPFDIDYGGIGFFIIDHINKKLLFDYFDPKYRLAVDEYINWSPDEKYAIAAQRGEVQDKVFFVNFNKNILNTLNLSRINSMTRKDNCKVSFLEDFKDVYWINNKAIFGVKIVVNPWDYENKCDKNKKYNSICVILDCDTNYLNYHEIK